jgi:pimeloyl-ACP methyl ester carboxylesterase
LRLQHPGGEHDTVRPVARSALLAIAAAGIASSAYQRIAEAADRRRYPPPGRTIDIGGRRMHILAEGEGSPAVVIIPALADNVLEWVRVVRMATAGAGTTVCVYDRAGVGWSDPPAGKVTLDSMADDLHVLLKAAGITPPYVVAGHSIGGVAARRFQARYPDDVSGMLLIDSSHEDQARRLSRRPPLVRAARRQARILGARRLAASLGLVRGLDAVSLGRQVPPEHAGAARAIELSARQRRIVVRELLLLARPQEQPGHLGALPLTVITSAVRQSPEFWAAWAHMQDELAALSSDFVHLHAARAGHYVHRDEPDLVAGAMADLVKRCR